MYEDVIGRVCTGAGAGGAGRRRWRWSGVPLSMMQQHACYVTNLSNGSLAPSPYVYLIL